MRFRAAPDTPTRPGRMRKAVAAIAIAVVFAGTALGSAGAAYADDATSSPEPTTEVAAAADDTSTDVAVTTDDTTGAADDSDTTTASDTTDTTDAADSTGPADTSAATDTAATDSASDETPVSTYAATSTVEHTGTAYTTTDGAIYYAPDEVTVGEPIHISGSGWLNTAGTAGSVITVKLDDGGVSTTADVTNPATGAVQANKTIYAIAQADETGEWELDIPWPTPDNSNASWGAGESHTIRLLTGSLLTGDTTRTGGATVTSVAAAESEDPESTTPAFTQDLPATATGTLREIGSASRTGDASDVTSTAIVQGVPEDATVTWSRKLGSAADSAAFTTVVPSTTGSGYVVDTSSSGGSLQTTITFTGSVNSYSSTYFKTLNGLKWYVTFSWTDDSGAAHSLTSTTTTWTALLDAPTIKTQPANTTVNEGATATFTVADTDGFGATYQWQSSTDGATWAAVAGSTATALTVPSVSVGQAGTQYRAVVTNTGGVATSGAATLTVNSLSTAPEVLTSPSDASATSLTGVVSFTATATLAATAVQWQALAPGGEWTDIAGAASLNTGTDQVSSTYLLDVAAVQPADGTQYRAAFSNSAGTTYTDPATLTMLDASATVTIAEDTVTRGGTVHVSATGLPANQPVTVYLHGRNLVVVAESAGVVTDANGALDDVAVQVPISYWGDDYYPDSSGGDNGLVALGDTQFDVSAGGYSFASDTVTVVDDADAALPVITAQPVAKTFATGEVVTYSVTLADNAGPLYTMWTWKQTASTPNEVNNGGGSVTMTQDGNIYTITVPANAASEGNAYRFWAWTAAGVVTSDSMTVHYAAATAPAVTTQPTGQLAAPGDSATFTAAASGVTTPDVQWQSSTDGTTWADVAGATQTTLTLSDVALADAGTQYRAVFTNQAGTATSNAAALSVTTDASAPTVTTQPQSTSVAKGDSATFTAAASGAPSPTVQWWSKTATGSWAVVAGATGKTLTVSNTTTTQSGTQYKAVFTNSAGSVETNAATLTVTEQATKTYTGSSDSSVTYTVPTEVAVGEDITISGTGWLTTAGTAGSVIGVKLDDGGVSTTLDVTNPADGTVQSNKTIWAVAQADSSGNWSVTFPFPTSENSNVTWASGETHSIRLLTGSLITGDKVRTETASFAITAGSGKTYTGSSDASVTYTVPTEVTVGEDITISGTGWLTTAGTAGSVIGVKLDDGGVSTTLDVTNPADGTVQSNKTIWAVAQADSSGNWSVTFPFPTSENSNVTWASGETHSIRLLTGSLITGDKVRTETASFTVVPAGVTCEDGQILVSDTVGGQTATACIQQNVSTDAGSTITVTGTGWLTTDGTAGATVVLKLASRVTPTDSDFQFVHTGAAGDEILNHPTNGTADPTMWALIQADADGTFTATIAVPTAANAPANVGSDGALEAGSKLIVHFQTGLLTTDTVHSFDSSSLIVDGQEYSGDVDGEIVECTATGAAEVHIESADGSEFDETTGPVVAYGGTIRLVGSGFCNNDPAAGGSTIAIKIDEGAYSHLPSEIVNSNAQVWALIDVNSADGSFDVEITVPTEGESAGGTTPGFAMGTHTLRLLTGSLKSGDPIRTLETGPFTVGAYQPNGAPDPVDADSLTDANSNGITIAQTDTSLVVTVPGAVEGDWIFVTPYATDGSPRYPWLATWYRADAAGTVTLPLAGVTLPVGTLKVAVQSGNAGESGTLLGWGWLTVASPPAADDGETAVVPQPTATTTTPNQPVYTLTSAVYATAPDNVPAAPFDSDEGLTSDNVGTLTAVQDGTVVTITLPDSTAGDWVYLYAYSDGTPIAVGWIQIDENLQVRVDVAALTAGTHKIAVLDVDGNLLGWVTATIDEDESTVTSADDDSDSTAQTTTDSESATVAASQSGLLSAADWWLIGGGAALLLAAAVTVLIVTSRRRAATNGGQQ